jgi:hypothetical protein
LVGTARTRLISAACSGCLSAAKRVDRGQPRVAGARAVAAVVFEMVEERLNQRRVEILDL